MQPLLLTSMAATVARASDLQPRGRRFNSRSRRGCVTDHILVCHQAYDWYSDNLWLGREPRVWHCIGHKLQTSRISPSTGSGLQKADKHCTFTLTLTPTTYSFCLPIPGLIFQGQSIHVRPGPIKRIFGITGAHFLQNDAPSVTYPTVFTVPKATQSIESSISQVQNLVLPANMWSFLPYLAKMWPQPNFGQILKMFYKVRNW